MSSNISESMSSNISYVDVSRPTIQSDMLVDLAILCLWPAIGLAVTALVFALGGGDQVIEALAVFG